MTRNTYKSGLPTGNLRYGVDVNDLSVLLSAPSPSKIAAKVFSLRYRQSHVNHQEQQQSSKSLQYELLPPNKILLLEPWLYYDTRGISIRFCLASKNRTARNMYKKLVFPFVYLFGNTLANFTRALHTPAATYISSHHQIHHESYQYPWLARTTVSVGRSPFKALTLSCGRMSVD